MYLTIICILFIYLLTIFKRKKLYYFYFCLGALGFVGIFLFGLREFVAPYMVKFTTALMNIIGKIFKMWQGYPNYGILFIDNGIDCISLNIDYECAAFNDLIVFMGLILFFPVYNLGKRLILLFVGSAYIVFANLVRLSMICASIYIYGNDSFYLSHTIIGRVIFFIFTLFLYFYIFTKAQIDEQKIGNFDY